ncbi:ABC transporter substrate-binding protein [Microvirga puerhi]|uniref:ABC transporter substrate-binding protein n=1 Tax=Microvirga puerhi TaxID=2876078 RepID=A0ABS7VUA3_9HYPH|nr:ABC transporter substrate-binding protein [Microvirga puerhi]MBZ6079157.1 ABC transporter substrate-binding protein [Microvirga puerhi]
MTTMRLRPQGIGLILGLAITVGTSFGPVLQARAQGAAETLRVANPVAIVSLDPFGAKAADQPTLTVAQEVLEPLVMRQDGSIVPWLAESWENPDKLTWTFHLKSGVRFADGSPLTSADAKASLDRLIAEKGPLAGLWAAVDTIEAPDEKTLKIRTTQPVGTMLSNLTMLGIAPAAKIRDTAFFNAPYGTGPFKVAAFTAGQQVRLVRNDSYWGEKPKLAQIEYRYIPEVSGRITALENNEIDFTWGLPPDQVDQVRGSQGLKVESFPTYSNYYFWFNSSRKPFTDARVRQAMWHAVDFAQIQKDLFPGTATVAKGPIPQAVFGSSVQKPYAYDVAKAKQLLADAGYANGFETTMMWSSQCCTAVREFAETLVSYWAKIGVKVVPQELERATWLDRLLKLDWDSTLTDGNTLTGDADFTLARLYLSTAKRMGYANPKLDELLLAARAELDQGKRAELYAEAGRIIWDEAVGIFPLDMMVHAAYRTNVTGFKPTPNAMPRFDSVSKK